MDGKGYSDEVTDRNGNMLLEIRGKVILCYEMAKSLAELYSYPSVLQKVELESDKIGCLAEAVFKQSVEVAAGFS